MVHHRMGVTSLALRIACSGAYRQLHARLRTNAEPVAFYGGIAKEGELIRASFRQLVKDQMKLLDTQWRFSMWQVGLGRPCQA